MAEKQNHRVVQASEDGGGPSRDHLNPYDMFSVKFPRVLVFDNDLQYTLILEKQLQEFQYEVTRCHEEEKAMYLLRNHVNNFDIAIIEAQNSDGDIFRLISEIASEMHLPIIIISTDDSVESVINWMMNGACDYLIKPIRPEDLRLIFKHVVKKMHVRSVAVTTGNPNKRKRSKSLDGQADKDDQDHDRPSTCKKKRVVWTPALHKQFIDAVEYLERTQEVVPNKILTRMINVNGNVNGLTRENVASHLQKYRMNEQKLKDQIERDKMNQSLITSQGGMYVEGSNEFYRGSNLQIPTHHINNISQPSSLQEESTNPNLMMQLIPPLGHHHHDGVSVAVPSRNLLMTHQHHHHHQISEFPSIENIEESLVYSADEDGVLNMACWFTQNSEAMSMLNLQEPVMATTMLPNDNQVSPNPQQMMNVHEPSMFPIHLFPSSLTHSSFVDQKETIMMGNVSGGLQQHPNLTYENRFLEN